MALNPLSLARRRPVSAALVLGLLAAALLVLFLRYWITTQPGRDFVVSQIEGQQIAGYGRLSVRKLEGDPLSDFSVGSLEIRDETGVWLTARDLRMTWSPLALLGRTADLHDVTLAEVKVARRPVRIEQPETQNDPWEVRLGNGRIDRLVLADGVAGPPAALGVSARFLNARNGSIDAKLQVAPLEGAGDRIEAQILRDRNSAFDLKIDGVAPAGGVFAHLLQLPDGASAILAATAAGDLNDGRGEARLSINGTDRVFLSGKIEAHALDAGLRFDAGALPLPPALQSFLGPRAEADVTAVFAERATEFEIKSRIATGTVDLASRVRPGTAELLEPARLKANLKTLAPYWDGAEALSLDGAVEKRESGYQYSGNARVDIRPDAGLPLQSASGPVTLSFEDGRVPFSGNVTVRNAFRANPSVSGIIGEDVEVSGNGVLDLETRRLLIDAAEVTHRSGQVQLLGEAGLKDRTLNLSGKVTQSVAALPGGFGGTASGFVQAEGTIDAVELGLNLTLTQLTSPAEALAPLIDGKGTMRGLLTLTPKSGTIRRLDIRLPGLEGQVAGRVYGSGSPDLRIDARQLAALDLSGNRIDLGVIEGRLDRQGSGLRFTGTSSGGSANVSGRSVSQLAADVRLLIQGDAVSGPVTLTGRSDGQPAAASFRLDRSAKKTRLTNIDAKLGTITFAGSAVVGDDGGLQAEIDADADAFEIAGITFGSLRLKGQGARASANPFDIGGEFEARKIQVTSRLLIDEITGKITTTPEGYRISGRMIDAQRRANSDLTFSGLVNTAQGFPAGRLSLSGALLGVPISTPEAIAWSLGPAPTVDAELNLLGGRLEARLRPGNETTSSAVTLENLSIAPVLAAFGLPAIDAIVSGRANGRLYGEAPEGVFELSAASPVSGVDTPLDLDLTGRLNRQALTFAGQSSFGPDFKANAAGRLPVATSPVGLASLDRERPIEAMIDIAGDLEALRLIALAYGQDIGGNLASRTEIAGTLADPSVKASAQVSGGRYEQGASGLSLKDIALTAKLENEVLTVQGSAAGAQGGTLDVSGRLAESEAGVSAKLNRLLVYDRLGDQARVTGDLRLTEGETDRVLSGALAINDARFNIDNFSDTSIRTLNVRWVAGEEDTQRQTVLDKPIRLDLTVATQSGVLIKGRGLDSNWGVNLSVTGRPDNLLLNGRATLVRGLLELAQRPFEFETGQITFDGPLETARLAITATREVDGFSVRADVGGAPTRPTIELSSTPSLPDDEILSRMLFGRSAVDLSALEAAELASSIARLAGRDTGLNPLAAIQSGLGVDRLRFGVNDAGNAELGVGQYLAPDVYLEVTTQGADGNSVEVEWQPRPQVSVTSETSSTGDSRISVRWKKDY